MKKIQDSIKKGFGLVEMIIGASILSVSLLSISNFFQSINRASSITQSSIQGDYLLEEGVEVVKIMRDISYTNNIRKMSTTTTYYLSWSGTSWATTTVDTLVDGKYTRNFTLTDVKRDVTSNDISTTGTYDQNVKLVTVSVAWRDPVGTTTRSIQTYVTNIFNN